jgi:hypothetical protein
LIVEWRWYHDLPGFPYLVVGAILLVLMVRSREKARRAVIGLVLVAALLWRLF